MSKQDLTEWDDNTVELSVGKQHRVILNTIHGRVIIDVRKDDVNAFTLEGPKGRVDFVLLRA